LLSNRIEGKWIDGFERTFQLCKIAPGDAVAILLETQSRRIKPSWPNLRCSAWARGPSML
jgi:hypothetical protein